MLVICNKNFQNIKSKKQQIAKLIIKILNKQKIKVKNKINMLMICLIPKIFKYNNNNIKLKQ